MKPVKTNEHYTWGGNCDGWHLLKTDGLSVIREKMPPGTAEQLHFHEHAQQLFYILSGVATVETNDQEMLVNTNESIHIPKMTKHRIANKSDQVLEFLVISEPKSHGDRQNL
jgi:mannose-6-phosphate isomerase-like protein (cupin superfamily)